MGFTLIIGLRVEHNRGICTAGVVLVAVAGETGATVGLLLASDAVLGVRSDEVVTAAAAASVVGIDAGAASVAPGLSSMVLVASVSVLMVMIVSGEEDDVVVVVCVL